MKRIYALIVIAVALLLSGCTATVNTGPLPGVTSVSNPSTGGTGGTPQWGVRTKTANCQVNGPLQDKACTPGDVFPDVTKAQICRSGYARSVRNVPQSEKDQVYAEYGILRHRAGQYEVDHLVSLELGGSNDISNLWPEAASPKPGFHEKDQVENYLHDQVCNGSISLHDAQVEIATNWLAVYERMPKNGGGSSSSSGQS